MRRTAFIVVTAIVAAHSLVATRAKSLVANTGQDDDTDLGIELRVMQGIYQLLHGFRAKRVTPLRAIDGDTRNAFSEIVANIGVFLAWLPG